MANTRRREGVERIRTAIREPNSTGVRRRRRYFVSICMCPMTHSFGAETQLRLGQNFGRWGLLQVSSPGDPAFRLRSFDCQVRGIEAIIPDLRGGVNQPCIGSNPTRGAKFFRYELSR